MYISLHYIYVFIYMYMEVPVMSDSLGPYGPSLARLLCPWDSPGKNTRVDFHAFLQGIFPTQGSNLGLMSPALGGGFFTRISGPSEMMYANHGS